MVNSNEVLKSTNPRFTRKISPCIYFSRFKSMFIEGLLHLIYASIIKDTGQVESSIAKLT